jgi:hypothetical protein
LRSFGAHGVASPHCRGFGDLLTSFLAINGTYERASRPCIPRTDRRHRGPLARYLERRRQLAQRVSAARITSPRGARTDGLFFLRWFGLSPSPIVSFATIPLESPRWVFPDLRNDPRWYVAHVTDAICRPTHWPLEVESSKAMRLGPRSRLEPPPRRDDFGLLRGAFGCWYRARHCRERGCPTGS